MYQLASCPPDLDLAIFDILDGRPNHTWIWSFLCINSPLFRQTWIWPFWTSRMALQTIYEFDNFYISNRILTVTSGSDDFGHPGWLSKLYMKSIDSAKYRLELRNAPEVVCHPVWHILKCADLSSSNTWLGASIAHFARCASSENDLAAFRWTGNHYERSVWRQKSARRSTFF